MKIVEKKNTYGNVLLLCREQKKHANKRNYREIQEF